MSPVVNSILFIALHCTAQRRECLRKNEPKRNPETSAGEENAAESSAGSVAALKSEDREGEKAKKRQLPPESKAGR